MLPVVIGYRSIVVCQRIVTQAIWIWIWIVSQQGPRTGESHHSFSHHFSVSFNFAVIEISNRSFLLFNRCFWPSTSLSIYFICYLCHPFIFYIVVSIVMVCCDPFWSAYGPILVSLWPIVVRCILVVVSCGTVLWSTVVISHTPGVILRNR